MMGFNEKGFWLMHGDCLERMKEIPDGSVDMVLADVPYGTTACKWDSIIPLEPMWEQLKRIIKPNGAIVMTASQPFTTTLIASNMKMFKYCWVWEKQQGTNPLLSKKQPMKVHEDVVIFYGKQCLYNPQMTEGTPYSGFITDKSKTTGDIMGGAKSLHRDNPSGSRYPRSVQKFNTPRVKGGHPTQKPVALMEYLIKTYTNEGETVLDFTMGSGTTGVACANTGRKFIGIELGLNYFRIARSRMRACNPDHLEVGTHLDNYHDSQVTHRLSNALRASKKYRAANATLDDRTVRSYRRMYSDFRMSVREIIDLSGLSHATVLCLLRGKTYKRLGMKYVPACIARINKERVRHR